MKFRKLTALICAAALAAPGFNIHTLAQENTITLTKSGGALESVYAEWENTESVSGYTVTCTGADGSVTNVDSRLIRLYEDHYRVDVPGLKAGSYTLSITDSNGSSVTTGSIIAAAHTREGFAFSAASPNGGIASGGYKADGTPASNAEIIYVTQENVNSVTLKIGSETCTGLCNILKGISNATKNGGSTDSARHYIIRVIGTIDGSKVLFNGNSDAAHHNFYVQDIKNLTIEGIGEDATLTHCAFYIKGCTNIELRNIGEMLYLDDGVAIEGSNSNIWVHNNDIFYGENLAAQGDDADKVKGDGSVDIKNSSQYCTVSYNHFWDGGKVSLVIAGAGRTDDKTNYLSYHHNWFDHTDSRHPRIRFASVHIYNNYFDGNQGYGTGVTSGASAFVESNYYRNCPKPMLSSMQGSDSGSFSKEAGGIIKAYGNYHVGTDKTIYYSTKTGSDFDAYKASSRDEAVPSSVTTKLKTFGGLTYNSTYNNFDTAPTMYDYTPDEAERVKDIVTANAGRVNGGDISYTFTESDDTDHSRNSKLDNLLLNYSPPAAAKLLSSYPATDGTMIVVPTSPPTPGKLTLVTAAKTWNFEEYDLSRLYDNMNIYFTDDKPIGTAAAQYSKTYSMALDLKGAGALNEYRSFEVYTAAGTLTVNIENTGSSDRVLLAYVNNGETPQEQAAPKGKASKMTVHVSGNSTVQFMSKSGGLRICSVEYVPDAVQPTDVPQPTEMPTASPSASPAEQPTDAPTTAPAEQPTDAPTTAPAEQPTDAPTVTPTDSPTSKPVETEAPVKLAVTASKGTDENGNLVVTAELNAGVNAVLIAARYLDGRLAAIVPVEVTADELMYDITLSQEERGEIKMMLWEDMNDMVPLLAAVTVE